MTAPIVKLLLTTMTWLCNVLGPRVMVRAVSASWHLRFGTCCHLISRTVMLVANSSSRALRLGSLCKLTHKRHLWELCLSGALQIVDLILFDLISSSKSLWTVDNVFVSVSLMFETPALCASCKIMLLYTTLLTNDSLYYSVHLLLSNKDENSSISHSTYAYQKLQNEQNAAIFQALFY